MANDCSNEGKCYHNKKNDGESCLVFDSILIWKAKRKDGQSSGGKDGKAQRFICSDNVHVHTYKAVHRWSVGGHIPHDE